MISLERRGAEEQLLFTCTESVGAYKYMMRLKLNPPRWAVMGFLVGGVIFFVVRANLATPARMLHDSFAIFFVALVLLVTGGNFLQSLFTKPRLHWFYESRAVIHRPANKKKTCSFAAATVDSMETTRATFHAEPFHIITVGFKPLLGKWYLGRPRPVSFAVSGPNDLSLLTAWARQRSIPMKEVPVWS